LSFRSSNANDLEKLVDLFKKDEAIHDILFVITYEGELPLWPE